MNKCPFCKQEIKEENAQVLVKVDNKPMRYVGKKWIERRYEKGGVYKGNYIHVSPEN